MAEPESSTTDTGPVGLRMDRHIHRGDGAIH